MIRLNKVKALCAIAVAVTLSACGAGGVDDASGGGGNPVAVAPIDGVDYSAVAKVGISEGQAVEFDFVNETDRPDGRTGGRITLFNGEELNGMADGAQHISIVYDARNGSGGSTERTHQTTYNEDIYDDTTREVRVSNVNVNGQDVIRASEMSLDSLSGAAAGTESFVYVPANPTSNTHVGMVGLVDSGSIDVGIFGNRTTAAQVSAQTGIATYQGVTEAYVRNGPNDVEGVYQGNVTATVNFGSVAAPAFSTSAGLTPELGGSEAVNYSAAGTINSNGSINAASGTLQGQAITDLDLNGGLYGPNAESMGYAYTLTGPGDTPVNVSGGAVLNKN
jgi:hypothetical protein